MAYEDYLRDGQVLCEVMNKIKPGSIPKVNSSGGDFKMMENINKYAKFYFGIFLPRASICNVISVRRFQAALKAYGVNDVDVFQTVDLWEKKDIGQVTTTLFALGRQVRI